MNPLPVADPPIECVTREGETRHPTETLYTGLVPGAIGNYQITVRLPAPQYSDVPSQAFVQVECGIEGGQDFASVPMIGSPSRTP